MRIKDERTRKILLDTTPMRLAIGTAIDVKTARLFSSAILLQYHTSKSTEGALVPQAIKNVEK